MALAGLLVATVDISSENVKRKDAFFEFRTRLGQYFFSLVRSFRSAISVTWAIATEKWSTRSIIFYRCRAALLGVVQKNTEREGGRVYGVRL